MASRHPPPDMHPQASPTEPPPAAHRHPGSAAPVLDSQSLLQGQGSVAILHHGVIYRLQATKLGKLILTK